MVYENPRPVYPNELYHHGIFGQHWGETNGPPYPLGSGTHNRVVRQGRAERKRLKSEYKDSKKNVENTAYQVRIARTNADKAAKKYSKSSVKNANKRSAKAVDARRTKEFWEKEYANALKTYQEKANAAGKKVKYDGSNRSTVLASTKAGSKGLYVLLGGLGGLANVARMNRMARNIEESKGFNRNLNQQSQKKFAEGKAAAKSEYKAKRALSKSERNAEKIKIDRANRLSKINEQIKNSTDSRDKQFMKAVRATIRGMSDKQYSKYSSGKMSGKEFNELLEMHDPY